MLAFLKFSKCAHVDLRLFMIAGGCRPTSECSEFRVEAGKQFEKVLFAFLGSLRFFFVCLFLAMLAPWLHIAMLAGRSLTD